MINQNFQRITIDIQVPAEFELNEEGRQKVTTMVAALATGLSDDLCNPGEGGVVVDAYDNLKDHHQIVVALGKKKAPVQTGKPEAEAKE